MLHAPAVISAEKPVLHQRPFDGIEHDVEAEVAVHVHGDLPAGERVFVENGVEVCARIVHGVLAGHRAVDLRAASCLGVEVPERCRHVADPRRAVPWLAISAVVK